MIIQIQIHDRKTRTRYIFELCEKRKRHSRWAKQAHFCVIELPWLRARTPTEWIDRDRTEFSLWRRDEVYLFISIDSSAFSCPPPKSHSRSHSQSFWLTGSKLNKFKLIYSFHFVHLEINLLYTFWNLASFSRSAQLCLLSLKDCYYYCHYFCCCCCCCFRSFQLIYELTVCTHKQHTILYANHQQSHNLTNLLNVYNVFFL